MRYPLSHYSTPRLGSSNLSVALSYYRSLSTSFDHKCSHYVKLCCKFAAEDCCMVEIKGEEGEKEKAERFQSKETSKVKQ